MNNYSNNLKKITSKRLAKSEAKPFSVDDEEAEGTDKSIMSISIKAKPKKKFGEIKSKLDKFASSGGDMEEAMETDEEEGMSSEEAMEELGSAIDEAKALLEDGDTEAVIELLDQMKDYYTICCE